MLLQIKIYAIAILYALGAIFMLLFPPRNFLRSGAKLSALRSSSAGLTYDHYLSHQEILDLCEQISKTDPDLANMVELEPRTAQNRTITALELRSDSQTKKPGILIVGGLDGMAWGVPNAMLELADRLLHDSNYQAPFFNDYDWYLIPLANPDGLTFTQAIRDNKPVNASTWSANLTAREGTRPDAWHKNMEKDDSHPCFGVRVNRNFAYHWQDDHAHRPDRCSQAFPGPRPFSAREAQAVRGYVDRLDRRVQLAVHLQPSYEAKKDLLLYPWRYTLRAQSNQQTLQAIGERAARHSRLPDGRIYEVHQGSSERVVAGSLSDYLSGVVGAELVYLLQPHHQLYPNYTDTDVLESFVNRAMLAILSLVRAWRKSEKTNTLSFFGTEVEF
ncbi:zinc carboxypeptidase A 1-like [Plutella xylostella]|uniref:zinc carboxypeptidase A 1-like n=1 Tax=Plutella xylostella TaxID=51655 RepID=UPI00203237DF|nr:zinc carboxypeptidase A 1-like [Plutella xylostella]